MTAQRQTLTAVGEEETIKEEKSLFWLFLSWKGCFPCFMTLQHIQSALQMHHLSACIFRMLVPTCGYGRFKTLKHIFPLFPLSHIMKVWWSGIVQPHGINTRTLYVHTYTSKWWTFKKYTEKNLANTKYLLMVNLIIFLESWLHFNKQDTDKISNLIKDDLPLWTNYTT